MPPPRNLKELQSSQGNLAFIRRFISNLAGRCQPFNHLMKKEVSFQWDEGCQNAFEGIKTHLLNQQVLGAPTPGKSLILYIAAQERSIRALIEQENEEGKEKALYYLSRSLTENRLKYSPIEKVYLALFYAIKKLRHYFEAYSIRFVSRADPVKFVMSRQRALASY
ncbi:Retrovirus-related Pol polyprotein from transposon opus [Sesamum angolense]|uniref:Retrovirus-related Pol polyprotein from transposon opus n=1 Tax=Sesamum angolense TaxID=2727404 RepID=A0AAE2BHK9_9LAMI|nr:Retrovirus-related Pol polyprotein from transposon opus [Sesamum angolense]